MFKRLRWTLLGALVGAGGSVWAKRRIRRTMMRYLPEQLVPEVQHWAVTAGDDMRAALEEGRAAMHEREAELRARFADRMVRPPPRRQIIDAEPWVPPLPAPSAGELRPAPRALSPPSTTQREQDGAPSPPWWPRR